MAYLSDYTAGTVTVSGTTVTGSGTAWQTAQFREGDWFIADGWVGIVASVESNTSATLVAWAGPSLSGAPYRMRYMSDGSRASAQARQLIDLLGGSGSLEALAALSGVPNTVPMFTGPGQMTLVPRIDFVSGVNYDVQVNTLADRAAYNAQPVGFSVLVGNIGNGRSAVYARVGAAGNWTDPAFVTGPAVTLAVTEVDEVPYGTPPDVTLTPVTGGYNLAFDIPRGMIIEPGTTTTLPPDQDAEVTFVPITGGFRLDIAIPRGPTGDIDGVTPFWVTRLGSDTDAAAARAGLGLDNAANIPNLPASKITSGVFDNARISQTLDPTRAFRRGNILGTVSQLEGIPTGAVIERGSNANGEYVRFADGTQICMRDNVTFTQGSGAFTSFGWTYPAPFVGFSAVPFVVRPVLGGNYTGNIVMTAVGPLAANSGTGTGTTLYLPRVEGAASFNAGSTITDCRVAAIGRWF